MSLVLGGRRAPEGRLSRLRRGAGAVLAIAVLGTAGAVLPAVSAHAADAAEPVYLTDFHTNSLVTYDLSSDSVVGTVPVGTRPQAVAVSPEGSQAWVVNLFGNSVSVVDTATNTVITPVAAGRQPYTVAFSPDGAHAYVSENAGGHPGIEVIDTATLTATAYIPVAYTATRLAPTSDGTRLYAAVSGDIAVIDTASNTVTASIPTADRRSIGGLAISPDGTKVYATNVNIGTLSVVDTASGTLAATVPIAQTVGALALSPDGARAYVTASSAGIVAVIDTATATVSATVPIAGSPNTVLADPDGKHLYVATGLGAMAVIDTASNTVVRTTAMGVYASAMAFAPAKPAIAALSPDHGPLAGGTTVTLTGSHFTGATAVTFGGLPATSFTVDSDTQITATAPAASTVATADVTATTPAGTSAAAHYAYTYAFSGFQAPVDNAPAVNRINAGHAVPLKFSLAGDHGLGILAPGQPSLQQTDCTTGAPVGNSAPADSAGALQYDSASDTYTWVWKTAKTSAGTCQTLTLGLNDATTHTALFQLR
ncbi:PxKF domain-containing protein [Streptomyces sp. NPDC051578]|uniref:PxKF domain-containing protein n=1 Tax=Streptomyces sp. NPDC051578 TaxID=3365662 RepID=UPI0037A5F092